MKSVNAFVLLKNTIVPDLTQLAETLRSRYPGLIIDIPKNSGSSTDTDAQAASLLMCAGRLVAIMSVAAPLPTDESLFDRATFWWPDAPMAFRDSTAHLIVAVMGEQDDPLLMARITTAVGGGLLSIVPDCLGVVWGGDVALPAQYWADMSQTALAPYPHFPALLWVGIHPFRDERTGGAGIVTQGLRRFIDRELELTSATDDVQTLLTRAEGLATYLIEKGLILKDGSTFGFSESERISVQLRNSNRFPGLPVIAGSDSV